jgi:dihydroxy-acid dehydratase
MVNAAIGGSTNAVIHLRALAGRLGIDITLDDFDRLARNVPVLVNLQPSGKYLMEDFVYAGGLRAVINELRGLLHDDTLNVNGKTLVDNSTGAEIWNTDVIGTLDKPFQEAGKGIAVLRGNLCPDGALIKQSAASPHLMQHTGPALVFDRIEDYTAVADDLDLPVTADTVLVIRNSGPRGYPGMPEIANVPLPRVLLQQGVRDIVRLSDARMSGTAYGTVVLHVSPESAVGGPLGLIKTGDIITLDVAGRSLSVQLSDAELARRRAEWTPPPEAEGAGRGYLSLYRSHVLQADKGADFDFLVGSGGSGVPRQMV